MKISAAKEQGFIAFFGRAVFFSKFFTSITNYLSPSLLPSKHSLLPNCLFWLLGGRQLTPSPRRF